MKSSIKYGGTLRQCDLFSCRYKNVWDIRYPRVSKLLIFFVKLLFETCRYLKRSYTYKKINNVLPSRHLINLLTMFRTHTLNLFYILSLLNQYLTLCVFNFKSVLKIQQRDMRHFICIALITITYDGAKKKPCLVQESLRSEGRGSESFTIPPCFAVNPVGETSG